MSEEIHAFSCTIPAGTAQATPITIPMPLPLYTVDSIDLDVPPGPGGTMGFYLELGSQQWIPWEAGEWIVWDDRAENWPLSSQPSSESWALVGYNNGTYDHTVRIRFHLSAAGNLDTGDGVVTVEYTDAGAITTVTPLEPIPS